MIGILKTIGTILFVIIIYIFIGYAWIAITPYTNDLDWAEEPKSIEISH